MFEIFLEIHKVLFFFLEASGVFFCVAQLSPLPNVRLCTSYFFKSGGFYVSAFGKYISRQIFRSRASQFLRADPKRSPGIKMSENVQNLSVTEQCIKSYKEVLDFVELCRSDPDETIINECVIFCDMNIALINALRSTVATTGGQNQSCYFTINLIQSLRDDLNSLLLKEGGGQPSNVKWLESESAFENSIRTGIIKNVRHIDPGEFFEDAKGVFAAEMKKTLEEKKHNLKIYTILEATYAREKGENTVEDLKHFRTKSFKVFMISNLMELFVENVIQPTMKDMEEFQERESGWTLKRIELLNVIINKYNPMRCGSYLPLPPPIIRKKACINIKNNDNQCLKWAVLCALTHLKGYTIHNVSEVSEYKKYENEFNLKFDGLEFPMDPLDVHKFEQLNDISINLYILKFEFNQYKV